MQMKYFERALLPVFAALLLTACGAAELSAPEPPIDSAAEQTTAVTTEDTAETTAAEADDDDEDEWSYGNWLFNTEITVREAQALIAKIHLQDSHPFQEEQPYKHVLGFACWKHDHYENVNLMLTEEYGWVFEDNNKLYDAPKELRCDVLSDLYDRVEAQCQPENREFTGKDFTLSIKDIAEGDVWLSIVYTRGQDIWRAKDYTLTDAGGKEYPAFILPYRLS